MTLESTIFGSKKSKMSKTKQKSASSPKHSSSTPRQLPRILEKMMRRGGRSGDRSWKKMGKLLKSGANVSKQKGKNTSFEEISRYLRLPLQHGKKAFHSSFFLHTTFSRATFLFFSPPFLIQKRLKNFFLTYFEKRIHCPSKDKIAFSNFPFTVPIALQHSLISSLLSFTCTEPVSLPLSQLPFPLQFFLLVPLGLTQWKNS